LESGGQGRSGHQALDARAPFTFARRNLCETAMQRRRAQWNTCKGDALACCCVEVESNGDLRPTYVSSCMARGALECTRLLLTNGACTHGHGSLPGRRPSVQWAGAPALEFPSSTHCTTNVNGTPKTATRHAAMTTGSRFADRPVIVGRVHGRRMLFTARTVRTKARWRRLRRRRIGRPRPGCARHAAAPCTFNSLGSCTAS